MQPGARIVIYYLLVLQLEPDRKSRLFSMWGGTASLYARHPCQNYPLQSTQNESSASSFNTDLKMLDSRCPV